MQRRLGIGLGNRSGALGGMIRGYTKACTLDCSGCAKHSDLLPGLSSQRSHADSQRKLRDGNRVETPCLPGPRFTLSKTACNAIDYGDHADLWIRG